MVRIQEETIRGDDLLAAVGSDEDGAVVLFLGKVRLHNVGREVIHLEYEAYPAMAESEMAKIVAAARGRYEISQMALVHRTGILKVGEVAVGVAVAAAHRAAALEACGFAIEELKQKVPIWKKEVFQGGESWIEDHPKSSSSRSSSSIPK